MRAGRWRLSPPVCGFATIRPSFAATGRGWAHPTSTCRRTAPGRRARWLKIQGPVPTGSGGPASNGGRAATRLQWLKAATDIPCEGTSGRPKNGTGLKDAAQRGCRKATRGAGNRPGGLTGPPWLRSRRPRTRRTLADALSAGLVVLVGESPRPLRTSCPGVPRASIRQGHTLWSPVQRRAKMSKEHGNCGRPNRRGGH